MKEPQSNTKTSRCARFPVLFSCLFFGLLTPTLGCQRIPWGSQQARQFQADSERLLGEFRAQKKRADDLAAKNQLLEQRLAESEKTLARQNLQGLAKTNSPRPRNPQTGGQFPGKSGIRSRSSVEFDDEGLPDVPPSMSGLLTSGSKRSERDPYGDPSKAPQWRPVHKR